MNEEELTGGSAVSQRHKSRTSSKQQDHTENINKSTQSITAVESNINKDESEKVSLDKREELQDPKDVQHKQFILKNEYTETPTELTARINSLPETYHKTLYLSLVEHLSKQQIATLLGVSLGTVKSQISRGRNLLRSIKQSPKENNIIDLQIERKRRPPNKATPSLDQVGSQILPEGEISLPDYLAPYQHHPESYNEHTVNIIDTGDSEAVKIYLQEISRIPTITHEREIELAQRIESGDQEARDQFILANLRLVVSIAKRYVRRGLPLIDLIQEGNIGLIQAIQRYDWRRGHHFSTYAIWWIRRAIIHAVTNQGRTIRLPIHVDTALRLIYLERQQLLEKLGREPTELELAEATGLGIIRIAELQATPETPVSLEVAAHENEEQRLGHMLIDTESPPPEESAIKHILRNEVQRMLETMLTPREQLILQMRFGFNANRTYTLEQIGQKLGLTRERVRQIEAGALAKLREPSVLERLQG